MIIKKRKMEVVFYMRKFKVNVNGTSYTVEVAEEGVVAVAPVAAARLRPLPRLRPLLLLRPPLRLRKPLPPLPLRWKSPLAIPRLPLRCLVKSARS